MNIKNMQFLIACAIIAITGCNGTVETSPAGYQHVQSLYQVSNQRDTVKIKQVAERINQQQAAGKLSDAESESLLAIVQQAHDGQWADANKAARKLMEAQLKKNR